METIKINKVVNNLNKPEDDHDEQEDGDGFDFLKNSLAKSKEARAETLMYKEGPSNKLADKAMMSSEVSDKAVSNKIEDKAVSNQIADKAIEESKSGSNHQVVKSIDHAALKIG